MVLKVVVMSEDIRVTMGDSDKWLCVSRFRPWQKDLVGEWLRELLAQAYEAGRTQVALEESRIRNSGAE